MQLLIQWKFLMFVCFLFFSKTWSDENLITYAKKAKIENVAV